MRITVDHCEGKGNCSRSGIAGLLRSCSRPEGPAEGSRGRKPPVGDAVVSEPRRGERNARVAVTHWACKCPRSEGKRHRTRSW